MVTSTRLCFLIPGESYYNYAVSEGRSPADSRWRVSLAEDDGQLARERRAMPDKSIMTIEEKEVGKDQPQQPQEQQAPQAPQPPQQQPQDQKPQQQQQQQPPAQQQPSSTVTSPVDVTYSRDAFSTPPPAEATDAKPDPKKKVTVSQPMNPATDGTVSPKMMASLVVGREKSCGLGKLTNTLLRARVI